MVRNIYLHPFYTCGYIYTCSVLCCVVCNDYQFTSTQSSIGTDTTISVLINTSVEMVKSNQAEVKQQQVQCTYMYMYITFSNKKG